MSREQGMVKSYFKKLYRAIEKPIVAKKIKGQSKVFCIGRNKTGTTSMAKVFKLLGLTMGHQGKGELFADDVLNGKYESFFKYVENEGVAFQDVPFSLPDVYKKLDERFPDSKFILTVRDSPEVWYNSLTSFHSKLFGNGNLPTKEDLMNAKYVHPGWIWKINRALYNSPEDDPYNKDILIKQYTDYNNEVIEYFKYRSDKLLVVNLTESNAAQKISSFLATGVFLNEIPWENRT